MTHYLFHQAGSIPGIPGTFGNCRVDINEDGTITQSPLHPFLASETPLETPLVQETDSATQPLGTPTEPLQEQATHGEETPLPEPQHEEQAQEQPAQEETPKQEETDHPHLEASLDPTPVQAEPQAQPVEQAQEVTPEPQPLPVEGETH